MPEVFVLESFGIAMGPSRHAVSTVVQQRFMKKRRPKRSDPAQT